MKMLRLPRSEVRLAVALPWNVYDDTGVLLLRRGYLLESAHQRDLLLRRGVYVDAAELELARPSPTVAPAEMSRQPNLFDRWDQTTDELIGLMHGVSKDAGFAQLLVQFAHQVDALVQHHPDIAIYRAVRQDHAQPFYYGYAHSVHSATMAALLGRHLGWVPERTMCLVQAALTMNIAILDLQGQMAGQEGPVRDWQRAAIRAHPTEGVRLLGEAGVVDAQWLSAVGEHHELADGGGYPLGSRTVDELAVALRVCDVLMARISPRLLRAALSPQEAARQLYREDHGGQLSTAMIQVLGIHPPGDFVRLASGELALVVQRTANLRTPIVAVLTDRAGRPTGHTVRRDSAEPGFAIAGGAASPDWLARLPPERLFGAAAIAIPGAAPA